MSNDVPWAAFGDLLPGVEGTLEDHARLFASPQWLSLHHHVKLAARTEFVRSLGIQRGATVLDAACGVGGWSSLLTTLYPSVAVTAVDTRLESLRLARQWTEVPAGPQPRLVAASVTHLPFPPGYFDVILLFNALQYAEVEAAVPTLYSALRPGGRLILRNFDEAFFSVVPCDPDLVAKVVWAAAEATKRHGSGDLDPYVGRRLGQLVGGRLHSATRTWSTATSLCWPFSVADRLYVSRNLEWLGQMARRRLTEREAKAWSDLTNAGSPDCIFTNQAGAYTTIDFCVEVTKGSDRTDHPYGA